MIHCFFHQFPRIHVSHWFEDRTQLKAAVLPDLDGYDSLAGYKCQNNEWYEQQAWYQVKQVRKHCVDFMCSASVQAFFVRGQLMILSGHGHPATIRRSNFKRVMDHHEFLCNVSLFPKVVTNLIIEYILNTLLDVHTLLPRAQGQPPIYWSKSRMLMSFIERV